MEHLKIQIKENVPVYLKKNNNRLTDKEIIENNYIAAHIKQYKIKPNYFMWKKHLINKFVNMQSDVPALDDHLQSVDDNRHVFADAAHAMPRNQLISQLRHQFLLYDKSANPLAPRHNEPAVPAHSNPLSAPSAQTGRRQRGLQEWPEPNSYARSWDTCLGVRDCLGIAALPSTVAAIPDVNLTTRFGSQINGVACVPCAF